MLIEIDLNEVKSLKLTINQFVLIKLLIDGIDIKSLSDVIPVDETEIDDLIKKNILTSESLYDKKNLKKLFVTDEFINKLKSKDFFDELYDLYPSYVTRSDGTRDYLRGAPSNCRKLYSKLINGSRAKHEHIKECLKFELSNRKQNNSMQYMKRLYKWLTSEEWLLYDEFMKDKKVQKKMEDVYGTAIE